MRRASDLFLGCVLIGLVLIGLMLVDARTAREQDRPQQEQRRQLVRVLQLTDLCLFTEAGYTRHPALADRHAPFADHPLALEHFPSGTLVRPPAHLNP